MVTMRTFIAVPMKRCLHGAIEDIQKGLSRCGVSADWVQAENLHLTLRFLGTTDKKDIPVIARAVARVALKQEPFEISFQGLGVFSLQRKRKVIWLGVAGRGASALRVLKRSIDCSLNEAGFRLKREKFMPHFTLGRTKSLSEKFKEAAKKSFEARGMEVNTIGFFKSETRASGVVYSEIESFRLG